MIIVEQEKTYLVNFDNVSCLTLGKDDEEKEYAIIAQTIDSDEITMGIYSTEERAKEILQDISLAYSMFQYLKSVKEDKRIIEQKIIRRYKTVEVYEMPEE